MKKRTPEQIRRLIEKDVTRITGVEPDSEEYRFGCVMLAASQVGVNTKKIAALLGRPRTDVADMVSTLRERKIFTRTRIHAEDWFKRGSGGIGFNIDLAVAMGLLDRVEEPAP